MPFVETAAELLAAFERETQAYVNGFEAAIVELEAVAAAGDKPYAEFTTEDERRWKAFASMFPVVHPDARAAARYLRSLMGTLKAEAPQQQQQSAAFPPEVVERATIAEWKNREGDWCSWELMPKATRELLLGGTRASLAVVADYLQSAEVRDEAVKALAPKRNSGASNHDLVDAVIAALLGGSK
jgi:hypothetical protein